MDNQHQKISGYRDLSQAEIDLMNEIKSAEEQVAGLYVRVQQLVKEDGGNATATRWASLGRSQLEGGFMFLTKAVARPDNGLGRAG